MSRVNGKDLLAHFSVVADGRVVDVSGQAKPLQEEGGLLPVKEGI